MSSSFDKLAPFIQEYIYRHEWSSLHEIQEKCIPVILYEDHHVLLTAGTAAGKTEAVFFPVLTKLMNDPPASFGALYIGPLKALINDQFERLQGLLRESHISLYAWHGDRSTTEKRNAMEHPEGILQITPEALEALLMKHSNEAKNMFSDLRFIIVDEIHAFMGTDRGAQLQCLMTRIDRLKGRPVRRIGLSATIQNPIRAAQWLAQGTTRPTDVIESTSLKKKLRLLVRHFDMDEHMGKESGHEEQAGMRKYLTALYESTCNHKCIVFANSRMEAEDSAFYLKKAIVSHQNDTDVRVHHGSISAAMRDDAEKAMRNNDRPVITCATMTLELGIDIGSLERVVQLGAPPTASSFAQRLGRVGRRGSPAQMVFLTKREISRKHKLSFGDLPWDLIRTIAIIELYCRESYVEDFQLKPCPYSLLVHQTLSHLMSREYTPSALARDVLTLPPFSELDNPYGMEDYKMLLRFMLVNGIIEKAENGRLIIGVRGAELAGNYRFYSVFQDNTGYQVIYGNTILGEIDDIPDIGEVVPLAGAKWIVEDVRKKERKVYVQKAKQSGKNPWMGRISVNIDERIVKKMRDILLSNEEYTYLDQETMQVLMNARKDACNYALSDVYSILTNTTFLLHPWLGSKELETIRILMHPDLLGKELHVTQCDETGKDHCSLTIASSLLPNDFLRQFSEKVMSIKDEDLIAVMPGIPKDRYDEYVPVELLKKADVKNNLNLKGVQKWAEECL